MDHKNRTLVSHKPITTLIMRGVIDSAGFGVVLFTKTLHNWSDAEKTLLETLYVLICDALRRTLFIPNNSKGLNDTEDWTSYFEDQGCAFHLPSIPC